MNRREFLKLLGLVFLGGSPLALGAAQTIYRETGRKRTAVIGAGLAGLAAASELRRQGQDVFIIEGRDRIGGRIWTSRKWPDAPLDLGASWIHGVDGNPITPLADAIEAPRLATHYERVATFNTHGQALTEAEEAQLDAISGRMAAALREAQQLDDDRSVRAALSALEKEFERSPQAARFLDFCVSSTIEQEYSGSATRLSAHWYDSARVFPGDDALFAQGFDGITEFLARGVRIERSQVVREIHWGASGVRVMTQATEFVVDNVIITLPLGVLQSQGVRFTPELPEDKRRAIASLGMGVLNKCYLRFREAFWPEDVDWLQYVSPRMGAWTEWVSFQRVAQVPILLGFNAAEHGRQIEELSDREIVDSGMATLRAIFGPRIPPPIDDQVTRWSADPFARGSYSYNALGSTPAMRDALAAPVQDRLFFAGEATAKDDFGTAHGAYLSGLRAARELLSK